MKLRFRRLDNEPIEFGCTFNGPGAQGFFGEGYWYQKWWPWSGVPWDRMTFAGKTTTLEPNADNMALDQNGLGPQDYFPKCIKAYPRTGHMVNAVGLAGPGAKDLFERNYYQLRQDRFFLSFMPKGGTKAEMVEQCRAFVRLLLPLLKYFRGLVALQANFACPNTGVDPATLYGMIGACLEVLKALGIPLVVNLNALVPVKVLLEVQSLADAYWIGNTIPWGSVPEEVIPWSLLEPGGISPLPKRLGDTAEYAASTKKGGLSGPWCFPLTLEKVREARKGGVTIPIVAGNGIQTASDVKSAFLAGASGIALATVTTLRPWRVGPILDKAEFIAKEVGWSMPFEERQYTLLNLETRAFLEEESQFEPNMKGRR